MKFFIFLFFVFSFDIAFSDESKPEKESRVEIDTKLQNDLVRIILDFNSRPEPESNKFIVLNPVGIANSNTTIVCNLEDDKGFFIAFDQTSGVPISFCINNVFYYFDVYQNKFVIFEDIKFGLMLLKTPSDGPSTASNLIFFPHKKTKVNMFLFDMRQVYDLGVTSKFGVDNNNNNLVQQENRKIKKEFVVKNGELVSFAEKAADNTTNIFQYYSIKDPKDFEPIVLFVEDFIKNYSMIKESKPIKLIPKETDEEGVIRSIMLTLMAAAYQNNGFSEDTMLDFINRKNKKLDNTEIKKIVNENFLNYKLDFFDYCSKNKQKPFILLNSLCYKTKTTYIGR